MSAQVIRLYRAALLRLFPLKKRRCKYCDAQKFKHISSNGSAGEALMRRLHEYCPDGSGNRYAPSRFWGEQLETHVYPDSVQELIQELDAELANVLTQICPLLLRESPQLLNLVGQIAAQGYEVTAAFCSRAHVVPVESNFDGNLTREDRRFLATVTKRDPRLPVFDSSE